MIVCARRAQLGEEHDGSSRGTSIDYIQVSIDLTGNPKAQQFSIEEHRIRRDGLDGIRLLLLETNRKYGYCAGAPRLSGDVSFQRKQQKNYQAAAAVTRRNANCRFHRGSFHEHFKKATNVCGYPKVVSVRQLKDASSSVERQPKANGTARSGIDRLAKRRRSRNRIHAGIVCVSQKVIDLKSQMNMGFTFVP
jgi:hypothetical protein